MWNEYTPPPVWAMQTEDSEACLEALSKKLGPLEVDRSIPGTVFIAGGVTNDGVVYHKLTIGHVIIVDPESKTVRSLPPAEFQDRYESIYSLAEKPEPPCDDGRALSGGPEESSVVDETATQNETGKA